MKEEKEYMRKVLCPSPCPADADAIDDCAPEVNPDDAEFEWALGKPKYEGGMSLRRLQKFLWEQSVIMLRILPAFLPLEVYQ